MDEQTPAQSPPQPANPPATPPATAPNQAAQAGCGCLVMVVLAAVVLWIIGGNTGSSGATERQMQRASLVMALLQTTWKTTNNEDLIERLRATPDGSRESAARLAVDSAFIDRNVLRKLIGTYGYVASPDLAADTEWLNDEQEVTRIKSLMVQTMLNMSREPPDASETNRAALLAEMKQNNPLVFRAKVQAMKYDASEEWARTLFGEPWRDYRDGTGGHVYIWAGNGVTLIATFRNGRCASFDILDTEDVKALDLKLR